MNRDPKKIGGTDAAAVLGISPWQSRLTLYERLIGQGSASEFTDDDERRLRAGQFFEPFIRSEAANKYGVEIRCEGRVLAHERLALTGHPDGYIGTEIGVDFKVDNLGPRSKFGEPETDQMPDQYLCQALHYMALDAATVEWQFFVLCVPSYELRRYRVSRNKDLIQRLVDAEIELLDRVQRRAPPDPADEAEARRLWFAVNSKVHVADTALQLSISRRELANRIARLCEKIASEEAKNILMDVQDAARVEDDAGNLLLTTGSNRLFDEALFVEKFPDAAAACMVTKIDREKARKLFHAKYEAAMRQPTEIAEQVRVLRAAPAIKAATTNWLTEANLGCPLLPELAQIAEEKA